MLLTLENLRLVLFCSLPWIIVAADESSSISCPESSGLFPIKESGSYKCSQYIQCKRGVATTKTCKDDHGFHPSIKGCVWEGFVPQCVHEKGGVNTCGVADASGKDDDSRPVDSWVVAVLYKKQDGWEYISSGLIISPTMVATSCLLGEKDRGTFKPNLDPKHFRVAAGLNQMDPNMLPEGTQSVSVKTIKLNPKSSTKSEQFCNAILVLSEPINLHGDGAKAACLPFFQASHEGYFGSGKVAVTTFQKKRGQATYKKVTKVVRLGREPFCNTTAANLTCQQGVRGQKRSSLIEACNSNSVATVYSPLSHHWFVLGVGGRFGSGFCRIAQFDTDTKLRWISSMLRCGDDQFTCNDGECIDLDFTCNGSEECSNGEDEDPRMCGSINSSDSNTHDNNGDVSSDPGDQTSSDASCPSPEVAEGSTVMCKSPGNFDFTTCDNSPPVGTIAKFQCVEGYVTASSFESSVTKSCTKKRQWSPSKTLACIPDITTTDVIDCGRRFGTFNRLIVNGMDAAEDSFPWHVEIFYDTGRDGLMYVCGGTLIHKHFILTAAHCIFRENVKNYRIVLGPRSSVFVENTAVRETQTRYVSNVVVNDKFDPASKYENDIALIKLEEAAVINRHVTVVCLPTRDGTNYEPYESEFGMIPGFGVDESGHISRTLKYVRFPVVSPKECKSAIGMPPAVGQFCAGFRNGTGVCNGDSGGGMVFDKDNRFYVKGIVSMGPRRNADDGDDRFTCDFSTYSVFTNVVTYLDWIRSSIETLQIEERRE